MGGIRTTVMELEEDGRWKKNKEGDEQLDKVNLVMRRGKWLGGQVRDAAQVGGDVRERHGEGLHVDVDDDGMRDKASQEIEGGQEQEDGVQEGDQSDQSVLTGVSESRWWEGREQDQGGLVQRGEASHGGEGEIQASIEAREVSVLERV